MEPFLGTWKLTKTEGFDEIMQRLGVNAVKRLAGNTVKPVHIFEDLGGGLYAYKTESTFKKTRCEFRLGQEFDEHTSDGRDLKSTITIESNGAMKQVQVGGGHTTIVERVVDGNTIVTTVTLDELISKRIYTKV